MLKALLTIGGLQLAINLILLARTKVMAVFLGPDVVGVMAVTDKLIAVLVQAASLSLPFAAVRFLPALWVSDRAGCWRLFRSMSNTVVTTSLVAAALALGVTAVNPSIWGTEFGTRSTLLVAALFTVPATVLGPFLQNSLAGILRHRASMIFAVVFACAQALAGFMAAWLNSLAILYASLALLGTLVVVVTLVKMRNTLSKGIYRIRSNPFLMSADVWRFASTLTGLSVLIPYATLYAHYSVLHQYGATEAGWMQAAMGISLAVRAIMGTAHGMLLTPHVNRGGTVEERMLWVSEFQRIWCFLAVMLVTPLLLAPNIAVGLLYTSSFLPGAKIVYLFILGDVIYMLVGSYQSIVIAMNQLRFHVIQNVTAQCVIILVAWLAIPRLGMIGAALAVLIAQCLLFASTSCFLWLRYNVRPAARTNAVTCYLIATLAAVGVIGSSGLGFSISQLARAVTIEVFVIGGLMLFVTREDWTRLRSLLSRPPASDRR